MIRAAAKNHGDVYVVTDPSDYAPLLDFLKTGAKGAHRGGPARYHIASVRPVQRVCTGAGLQRARPLVQRVRTGAGLPQ